MFRIVAACLFLVAYAAWSGFAAAQDEKSVSIEGWGTSVDPAGGCKVGEESGKVTITVPGTEHNLNPTSDYDNVLGPRLLQPVTGDFTVEATVLAFPVPEANTSTNKQGHSYVAAGLIVWVNDKTFLRCLRASMGERGDTFLHVEAFQDAEKRPDTKFFISSVRERIMPADQDLHVRIERRGNEPKVSRSADKKTWSQFASQTFQELAAKLEVGVGVVNAVTKEFSPQFEELQLESEQEKP